MSWNTQKFLVISIPVPFPAFGHPLNMRTKEAYNAAGAVNRSLHLLLSLILLKSMRLGKYCRKRPLLFSFRPRSHE
jgi:hypothetical protein